ncbi:MAG: hypothetical protein V4739_11750 [Pseudomonadota bacterium]
MATIHMTLSDTPAGGVAIRTTFKPAIGQPCTPAQGHALEIVNRTQKQWGVAPIAHCECDRELTPQELDSNVCSACGKLVLA